MNDIERAIKDLKDINIIQKQRHMCKALDGEVTTKEIENYRSRFASVNLAISALEKQVEIQATIDVCEHMEICKTYWCNKFDALCDELCREVKNESI